MLDTTLVRKVLIGGAWMDVYHDSFAVTPFRLGGLTVDGFSFQEGNMIISGPLSSIGTAIISIPNCSQMAKWRS